MCDPCVKNSIPHTDDERRGEGAAVETGFQVRGTGGGGRGQGRAGSPAAAAVVVVAVVVFASR